MLGLLMHIQRHFESLAEGNRGIWIYSAISSCLTLKRVLNETGKKKKQQDLISDQTIEKSTHRLLLHGITPWDFQLLLLIVFFFFYSTLFFFFNGQMHNHLDFLTVFCQLLPGSSIWFQNEKYINISDI